jgi:hypothetical protein
MLESQGCTYITSSINTTSNSYSTVEQWTRALATLDDELFETLIGPYDVWQEVSTTYVNFNLDISSNVSCVHANRCFLT